MFSASQLSLTPLPALAMLRDDSGRKRVVVLAQCDGQRVLYLDLTGGGQGQAAQPTIEPLAAFATR